MWLWARRIAGLVMFASVLVGAIALFADPETLTLDFPWGTRDAGKWEAILLLGLAALIGGWQFVSLNSEAARAAYEPPTGEAAEHE